MKLHLVCQRQGWEWGEQARSCLLCGSDRQGETCLAAPFFLFFFFIYYYFPFPPIFEADLSRLFNGR